MSPTDWDELGKFIDKNLVRGVIYLTSYLYAAPVLFRKRKDGVFRLCVQYRWMNSISVSNAYHNPLIWDLLGVVAN